MGQNVEYEPGVGGLPQEGLCLWVQHGGLQVQESGVAEREPIALELV